MSFYPSQTYKNGSVYYRRITEAQWERVCDFNRRLASSGKPPIDLTGAGYAIDFVDNDHEHADMITIHFMGMVVGILPDGSAHS